MIHNFPNPPQNFLIDVSDLDIPIAHKKGTHQCTKHHIANSLSYHKMSHSHKAFTSKITDIFVPRNVQEALNDLNWKLAVTEVMNALKQNCTWYKRQENSWMQVGVHCKM